MARNIRHDTSKNMVNRDASSGKFTSLEAAQSHSNDKLPSPAIEENEESELLPLSPQLEKMLEDSWADNEELYWALKNS